MPVQVERRQFTIGEYARMGEAGIFTEDDRVELIEGEIIKMSPIGSRHAACVDRVVNTLLARLAGERAIVRVQSPIILDDYSEPQPDVTLLKLRADFYAQGHPTPADVLLIVEVADSSIEIDRDIKLPLYARAGIPQVLLVNIPAEVVESYSDPLNDAYQNVQHLGHGEAVNIEAIPGLMLSVDIVLG